MNATTRTQIKADVQQLLRQGPGAEKFYAALARMHHVSLEEVQEIAAECGPARNIGAEQAAQEQVASMRRASRTAAYRAYNHLED